MTTHIDQGIKQAITALTDALGARSDLDTTVANNFVAAINEVNDRANTIIEKIGGQLLFDPNEINGWGVVGPIDDTNAQDLGDVGAANLSRLAGGISYPFDVRIERFYAWHQNNNADAQAWGWVLAKQEKQSNSNTVATDYVLDEVADNAGVGPRDYSSTVTQLTDIDLSSATNNVIPAGEVLTLGAAAPTAVTTNRYVRVMSGYLHFTRVS